MSDDADQVEDDDLDFDLDESENQKSGSKKKILFIVLPLLLLGGAGAGLYFSGLLGGEETEEVKAEEPVKKPVAEATFFNLPVMLVNLNSAGTRPYFMKVQPSLEISGDVDTEALHKLSPRIVDRFQIYLRELRLDDFRGKTGIHGLRDVLLAEVNRVTHPVKIDDVLFRDILIQ